MIEQRLLDSQKSAHVAATELYNIAKVRTRDGQRYLLQLVSTDAQRRHQLRKMFHGPVLNAISEQVWLPDPNTGRRVRYAPAAWKLLLADLFIGPSFEEHLIKGVPTVTERRRSTEELLDDEFALFLHAVQAFAVVDLGVEFPEEGEQP